MIPLLGRSLILLSLLAAGAGAIVAFAAAARRNEHAARIAERLAYAYGALIIAANVLMIYALIARDFSVSYVAQVGSRSTPLWVTVSSLWASLEGSILFWGLVLGAYVVVATWAMGNRFPEHKSWAIGVWLAVAAFFSFLLAGPAQAFGTVAFPPADGPGPNPLLQNHILMTVHPPFLYLGYVGMTIPFGIASAALLAGRFGQDLLKTLRTSLLFAWSFLTVAIVMGGWWAYEVLGWGGYWAWDPVENASFLPWLTATAALHSGIVMERKSILKGWTVTLVLSTFLLTILGTFMTRSGVFNSVHSFTQSSIGPTILAFLAVALVWTVVLLALRIDRLSGEGSLDSPASREGIFLVNNLLFVLFTLTVLIGTVFPLIVEAVRNVQMSVGSPYFNQMAVPIGLALLFLMGVGPALPWGRATRDQMVRALVPPVIGGVVLLVLGYVFGVRSGWTLATLFFGGYTAQITFREMWLPMRTRMRNGEKPATAFLDGQMGRGRRRFASYIIHGGAVLIFIAIAVSSTMKSGIEVQLRQGESASLGGYTFTFTGARSLTEPHRQSVIATTEVRSASGRSMLLEPRMNYYSMSRDPIGTPDVKTTWKHDIYLSVMNVDPSAQTAGLHIILNPMVGWIWIATGIMALGALFAIIPIRRRSLAMVSVAPRAGEVAVES